MKTEIKTHVPQDAQSECWTCDSSSVEIAREPTPSLNRTRVKRLERSEEIARALHLAPTRSERTLRRVVVVFVALVVMCLVMAAIVWWRLLT